MQAGDCDMDGVGIPADAISGGSIREADGSRSADTSHVAQGPVERPAGRRHAAGGLRGRAGGPGPGGRLKATDAAVTRFRTGLEGSRNYTLAGWLLLKPSVEVRLRHDGGDAETGAGMDVGGGLVVSDG